MSANEELRRLLDEQMEFVLSQTPEALQAENTRLRIERDEWHRVAESKQDIIDHMRDANAENAKLRELVQTLVHCLNDVDCDKCPLNGNPYEVHGEWAACDALRDRMRELEVDA